MLLGSIVVLTLFAIGGAHYLGKDIVQLPKQSWSTLSEIPEWLWILALVQGIVGLVTSIGLFAKKRWAYNLYTVVNGFAIGLGGFELVKHQNLLVAPHLAWSLLIMIYMLLPGVRKAFG